MGQYCSFPLLVTEWCLPLQVSSTRSYGMVSQVPQSRWLGKLSPLQMLKAVKNETEAKGMRAAHVSSFSPYSTGYSSCDPCRCVMELLCVSICAGWRRG